MLLRVDAADDYLSVVLGALSIHRPEAFAQCVRIAQQPVGTEKRKATASCDTLAYVINFLRKHELYSRAKLAMYIEVWYFWGFL